MRLCAPCSPNPSTWTGTTAPPGRCSQCGRAFDIQGMPLEDEAVTCPLHDPILADCPHMEAGDRPEPLPRASWLESPTPER